MSLRIGLAVLMVALFAAVAFTGYGLARNGSALPLLIGSVGLGLSAWQLLVDVRHRAADQTIALGRGDWRHLAWFVLLLLVVLLFGFVPGAPVWMLLYLRWGRGEGWALSLGLSGAMLVLLWGGFAGLAGLSLFEGLLRT